MTQPTEPFAQHARLAELVTALGFRRYPLFLTGLLYEEPGGPLRRAAAVASRDATCWPTTPARYSSTPGASRPRGCSTTTSPGGPRRPWWTPWPTATRRSSLRRWPRGPGGRRSLNEVGIELLHHWFLPERPPLAITHSEVLGVVPLEVTDALLDELRRLADRHERGFLVEHVMELLATS